MRKLLFVLGCFHVFIANAQDSARIVKRPVEIFSSEKAINANTPQTVGRGKMAFKVSHNFGDIAGKNGGIKQFFGLDNSTDVRIGFETGLSNRFDLITARAKGAGLLQQLWELGFKYQLMRQEENGNPLSVAVFANTVISTQPKSAFPNQENSFEDFGDRISNVLQLIVAKRMGGVSAEILPTYVTRGHTLPYDQKSIFALGAAVRFPIIKNRMNLLLDYFHPFRSESTKDSFLVNQSLKFYDPLGIGFEILTSGHVFRMNFTNATELLENRFIPRTVSSWGKGQFRWGFTISRSFTLWR